MSGHYFCKVYNHDPDDYLLLLVLAASSVNQSFSISMRSQPKSGGIKIRKAKILLCLVFLGI